jgi:hypothetical protein
MKGLQRVNRAVLKQLATARVVERVDLSRCGVDMDGLGKYLSRLDTEQMARMKVFRCAGVKGRGRAVRDVAASLGQMRNLEVLDLGGTSLDDESVHAWIDSYAAGRSIQGASGRSAEEDPVTLDRLRHLRLTGCDHLSPAALKALTGRLPCLESFELAAVPKFLRSAHTHDHTASQTRHQLARDRQAVASFFASCEGLRRVDLDDFGTRDGGVSNEMLEALEGEVIEEVHIAESGAGVDVECMVRFVRRCKHLRVFNVDVSWLAPGGSCLFLLRHSSIPPTRRPLWHSLWRPLSNGCASAGGHVGRSGTRSHDPSRRGRVHLLTPVNRRRRSRPHGMA